MRPYLPSEGSVFPLLEWSTAIIAALSIKNWMVQGFACRRDLKDGGPVHPYDEHFRFGVQKARLLLAALEIIKEFAANTDEEGNTTVTSQFLHDGSGAILQIWVEMHEDFVRSTGEKIERPWLQIRRMPDGPQIGLGVQKAKAVCALIHELRNWLERAS